MGLFAKWRRPHVFDRGGGWISAVHRVMDGWRGADASVDSAVDHGPRVHRELREGVLLHLIRVVDLFVDGWRDHGPRRGRGLRVHDAPAE
jgi:hypothetical protein